MTRLLSLYAITLVISGLPELLLALSGLSIAGSLVDFVLAASLAGLLFGFSMPISPQRTLPIVVLIGLVHTAQPLLEVMIVAAALLGLALTLCCVSSQVLPKRFSEQLLLIGGAHFLIKQSLFLALGYFDLSVWAFIAMYLFVMLAIIVSYSNVSPPHHTTSQWRPARPF